SSLDQTERGDLLEIGQLDAAIPIAQGHRAGDCAVFEDHATHEVPATVLVSAGGELLQERLDPTMPVGAGGRETHRVLVLHGLVVEPVDGLEVSLLGQRSDSLLVLNHERSPDWISGSLLNQY